MSLSEHLDPLDTVFPDSDGTIAALVASLPAPEPAAALRVSALLAGAR